MTGGARLRAGGVRRGLTLNLCRLKPKFVVFECLLFSEPLQLPEQMSIVGVVEYGEAMPATFSISTREEDTMENLHEQKNCIALSERALNELSLLYFFKHYPEMENSKNKYT